MIERIIHSFQKLPFHTVLTWAGTASGTAVGVVDSLNASMEVANIYLQNGAYAVSIMAFMWGVGNWWYKRLFPKGKPEDGEQRH